MHHKVAGDHLGWTVNLTCKLYPSATS